MQAGEKARIEAAGGTVNDVGGVARVNSNLNLSRAIGDLKYKGNTALPPQAQVRRRHSSRAARHAQRRPWSSAARPRMASSAAALACL